MVKNTTRKNEIKSETTRERVYIVNNNNNNNKSTRAESNKLSPLASGLFLIRDQCRDYRVGIAHPSIIN